MTSLQEVAGSNPGMPNAPSLKKTEEKETPLNLQLQMYFQVVLSTPCHTCSEHCGKFEIPTLLSSSPSPQPIWSVGCRQERPWDNGRHFPTKSGAVLGGRF